MLTPDFNQNCGCCPVPGDEQTHVHEFVGSVQIDGKNCELHNHRFATVSDEVEFIPGVMGHVHKIKFRTDFYEDHYHEFTGYTGGPIDVCDGRHVHYICNTTNTSDQHQHEFRGATLIDNPIGEDQLFIDS